MAGAKVGMFMETFRARVYSGLWPDTQSHQHSHPQFVGITQSCHQYARIA